MENRISLGVKKTAQPIQEGFSKWRGFVGSLLTAPKHIAMTKETQPVVVHHSLGKAHQPD